MRAARSILGLGLAILYAAAFAVAYWLWAQQPSVFLSDLWLSLAAVPYLLTVRALTGGADFSADSLGDVLAAAAFCCALAYLGGAIVEALLRAAWRLARRNRPSARWRGEG